MPTGTHRTGGLPQFFLRVLCGFSSVNFAVKGCCSRRRSKDLNREGREGKAAKYAKKFKLRHSQQQIRRSTGLTDRNQGVIGFQRAITHQIGYLVRRNRVICAGCSRPGEKFRLGCLPEIRRCFAPVSPSRPASRLSPKPRGRPNNRPYLPLRANLMGRPGSATWFRGRWFEPVSMHVFAHP
jgi:hypothetical protein